MTVFLSGHFQNVTFSCLLPNNKLSFFNSKRYTAFVTATTIKRKAYTMNFDNIINNDTNDQIKHDSLVKQAIKRREYNRRYQAKLRETAKLLTLEKKIDANLQHVIGYIRERYAKEYADYVKPVKQVVFSNSFFDNWLVLSASEYKSVREAFEVSTLGEHMTLREFTKLFEQHYERNNSGKYSKS